MLGSGLVRSATWRSGFLASVVLAVAAMRLRHLALLVALYVSLDLTNPFVGGAFSFDVDESLDAVSSPHEQLHPEADTLAVPEPPQPERGERSRSVPVLRPQTRRLDEWLGQLRQAQASLSDPQSANEDH